MTTLTFEIYYKAFEKMSKHDPRYMSKPQARKVYKEYANTCIKKLTRLKVRVKKPSSLKVRVKKPSSLKVRVKKPSSLKAVKKIRIPICVNSF